MQTKSNRRHSQLLHSYDEAQRIAFGPLIFQATASAIDLGILKKLSEIDAPVSIPALAKACSLSEYGIRILVELLSTAHIVTRHDNETYSLGKTGECLLFDRMTQVNFNFVRHVNFEASVHTTEAITKGIPAGLKEFDPSWKTLYPHLKDLPENARRAWFEFDHYYSDVSYQRCLSVLQEYKFKHLADIGGNTGKFAKMALNSRDDLSVTIVDLPEQIGLMRNNPDLVGLHNRIYDHPINWLDQTQKLSFAEPVDCIWMSQFLDCFSLSEAQSIIERAKESLDEDGIFVILEPLWDHQPLETSSLCLTATSLYFTIMANGNSRFFGKTELESLIERSGLKVMSAHHHLGVSHSMYICRKA